MYASHETSLRRRSLRQSRKQTEKEERSPIQTQTHQIKQQQSLFGDLTKLRGPVQHHQGKTCILFGAHPPIGLNEHLLQAQRG
jgi:hypothetical protein